MPQPGSSDQKSSSDEIRSGDEALISVADLLYQKMRFDPKFQQHCSRVDLPQLALQLRRFLMAAFGGQVWPQVYVGENLMDSTYHYFSEALTDAIAEPLPLGVDLLLGSFDVLIDGPLAKDSRVETFFDSIRAKRVEESAAPELVEAEEEEDPPENVDDEAVSRDETEQPVEENPSVTDALRQTAEGDSVASGAAPTDAPHDGLSNEGHENPAAEGETNVTAEALERLELEPEQIHAVQETWTAFIESCGSQDQAGLAIFEAVFETTPALESMFTSARSIQAMKFMNALTSIVNVIGNPEQVKALVGALAFGHLSWDIGESRFALFRDAMFTLFKMELDTKFSATSLTGWKAIFSYVTGIFVFVRENFTSRCQILIESWKLVNSDEKVDLVQTQELESSTEAAVGHGQKPVRKKENKKKFWSGTSRTQDNAAEEDKSGQKDHLQNNKNQDMHVPTNYPDMFRFNASVMGFGNRAWFAEVLGCFHNIVTSVANSTRLQQECDVLALRISNVAKIVNLAEYKSCMLASLRSLLPGTWDTEHELAWNWLWENVSVILQKLLGKPKVWEVALGKVLNSLSEEQKADIRKNVYINAFTTTPTLQEHFKQSDTRLQFIAARIIEMSYQIFRDPIRIVDTISAVGLRHVGYGIPTNLLGPLVTAYIEVVLACTNDGKAKEAFCWSMGLLLKMVGSTIKEGSTIVMRSINVNSAKALRKAVSGAPRKYRASWMLMVQVGSQDISPLAWAIESGSLEAAGAIIEDLLTIRADRDRYYYGLDDLFGRHPDIVKRLCADAPTLLPLLLDGMLWRSRMTENGMRRVNYYFKHLLIDSDGIFAKNMDWIIRNRDPKIVCHPVIVFLSNTVWKGCAYLSFLYQKSWFFLTLLIFISSQSILEHLNEGENGPTERTLVFICRGFIYLASLTQLVYVHAGKILRALRAKEFIRVLYVPIPAYLENWQETAGLVLTVALFFMLVLEPIIHCWNETRDGKEMESKFFTEDCSVASSMEMTYSIFSSLAMLLYYVLLIDLAVFSTRVSAYVLVCFRMTYELMLFLLAAVGTTLAFASAISVIKHDTAHFDGIPPGSLAMMKMLLAMYSNKDYQSVESEPMMLVVVSLFLVLDMVFLINLLIAQLNCAYATTYTDMLGFAILKRIKIIVETMPSVSRLRWTRFIGSLQFDNRLEFNEGDIGLHGGVQIKELASENPTTVDTIRRYGGSTSAELPWPVDDAAQENDNDRLDKLEGLVQRFEKRTRNVEKALLNIAASMKGQGGMKGGSQSGSAVTPSGQSSEGDAVEDS